MVGAGWGRLCVFLQLSFCVVLQDGIELVLFDSEDGDGTISSMCLP